MEKLQNPSAVLVSESSYAMGDNYHVAVKEEPISEPEGKYFGCKSELYSAVLPLSALLCCRLLT